MTCVWKRRICATAAKDSNNGLASIGKSIRKLADHSISRLLKSAEIVAPLQMLNSKWKPKQTFHRRFSITRGREVFYSISYSSSRISKLFALLTAVFMIDSASAFGFTNETAVSNYLINTEKEMIRIGNLDKKRALLLKDLELKRANYARAIQLLSEKVLARKDLEQARIEYEKVLIELVSSGGRSAEWILAAINKQRSQLQDLTDSRGIAATGAGAY